MAERLVRWTVQFCVMCASNYPKIVITTALVAGLMAAVFLIIKQQVLTEEGWLNYLGIGFGVFFMQYGFRAYAAWRRGGDYSKVEPRQIERWAQTIFSNINSFCFLIAALALLYWLPPRWWRLRWAQLLMVLFLVSAIAGVLLQEPWDRRIDALLSAGVLGLLSLAFYMNSGGRQRRRWAPLYLVGGFLYAVLHIVYGYVPNIARSRRFGFASLLNARLHSANTLATATEALDRGIFAIAFFLKCMLFIGAFLVIMRCLSAFSPSVSRKLLEPVKTGRGEFLSSSGIVQAMAKSIGADAAALCFRLPGARRDEVVTLTWTDDGSVVEEGDVSSARPLPARSTLGQTLVSDEPLYSGNWQKDSRFNQGAYHDVVPGMLSFLNMPLLYHGAAVGGLNFEWRKPRAFTRTDVQRVRQIADYVTPVVQTERWLRAIADLRERLQFYNFDIKQRSEGRFIARVATEIHDVLEPAATLLLFDFGFNAQWAMRVGNDTPISSDESDDGRSCQTMEGHFRSMFGVETSLVEIPMPLMGGTVGKILLATSRYHDELAHPSLTTDRKQQSAIGVLVKDALLDLHRSHFGGILHDLHSGLDAGGFASELHWLRTVRDAAGEAGLKGVGVYPDKTGKLHDEPTESIGVDVGEVLDTAPLQAGDRRVFRWRDLGGAPQAVLELSLPLCGEILYIEIGRTQFGKELESELPWKVFLDRLADAADSALVRIRAIELESDAMQFEMNALLVHELRNPAEEFQQAVEWLDENLFESLDVTPDDPRRRMLDELKRSALKFMELANAVVKPVSPDNRSAVPLTEVRDSVERLYAGRLAARGINLSWEIEDTWVVGVPLHLAYIVLVSLVQNAREAIGDAPGRIHVRGEEVADGVLLHVDDTGGGIRDEHRPHIFKLGYTTKKRGSGRGLGLAKRALHRHKGDLHLAEHNPAGVSTRFTILFPRS